MSRSVVSLEDKIDLQIQQNVTNWQSSKNPLAPLLDEQLDLVYQMGDLMKRESLGEATESDNVDDSQTIPEIDTNRAYIKWMIDSENEIKYENLREYQAYHQTLESQMDNCENLFLCVCIFFKDLF